MEEVRVEPLLQVADGERASPDIESEEEENEGISCSCCSYACASKSWERSAQPAANKHEVHAVHPSHPGLAPVLYQHQDSHQDKDNVGRKPTIVNRQATIDRPSKTERRTELNAQGMLKLGARMVGFGLSRGDCVRVPWYVVCTLVTAWDVGCARWVYAVRWMPYAETTHTIPSYCTRITWLTVDDS